ncbi:MAG TPA: hypothetical protein VIL44_07175 [Micromonospora sp.]
MTSSPTSPDPIAQITPGMRVIDSTGHEVGTVIRVRVGDPNAVIAQGPTTGTGSLEGRIPDPLAGDEPEVPPDIAARMLRFGYLKVDTNSLFLRDVYVEANQISTVVDDQVLLNVPASSLTPEV